VDEARKFLECSRNENDPLYPLWVLILVLGLRKGEALGLIEPDDGWQFTDENTAVIDLEWQLQRVGGHPLTHKQVLKADGSTDTLPLPPICVTALRIAKRNQDAARANDWPEMCICGKNTGSCSPPGTAARSRRGTSTVLSTSGAPGTESAGSRFTTPAARAAHCWPPSTCTRASPWRYSGTAE
jgi:hypothetical protein